MYRRFLILLFAAALSLQARAQRTFHSLEEVTQFAIKNRPDLQNEDLAQQVAQQQVRLSKAGLYPQVKAIGSLDDYLALPVQLIPAEFIGGQPGQMAEVQFGTQYALSAGLEAVLPLVNTQAWQNKKIALAEAQFTRFKSQDTYLRASEIIARTYYLCLLSKEAVALSQENARLNDTLLFTATHRFAAGLIEPLELNRLKALQLESQQQLSDNQTTYQNNLSRLKALLGLPPQEELLLTQLLEATVELAATPPPVAEEQLGLYQALRWRLQVAEEERQKQRLRWVPEISAYGRFTNQAQRNTFNFLESKEPWYQVGLIGVKAEWPLFTGFSRRASLYKANLQKQIAANELQNFKIQAQAEVQELEQNYRNARQSLNQYRQHFALYQDNYTIARYKYTHEVFTVDQLLQVYGEQLKSQNLYLNALANYYVSFALLQIKIQFSQPAPTAAHGN